MSEQKSFRRNTEIGIDLPRLYVGFSKEQWNKMLTQMRRKQDIEKMSRMIVQLDIGMRNCVKQKLDDDKIVEWYLRLKHSLERTIAFTRMDIIRFDKNDPRSAKKKKEFEKEWEAYQRRIRF